MAFNTLSRTWWIVLLRGLSAITFGILAFVWPGLTLVALVVLYGVYALIDGVLALYAALSGGATVSRWWLVAAGLLGLAAGIITLLWPGMTAIVLIMFIGAWALGHGIVEIIGAIRLRKEIENEWWLIGSGLLSVIFGLIVITRPGAGALAMIWLIGGYAIAFGCLLVGLALRLKKEDEPVLA